MCGIVGFAGPSASQQDARQVLAQMTALLAHRGPDDEGLWLDPPAGIALGHRRLSILDVTSAGHQPMSCRCGRHVVSYNGEIYNYRGLRADLEAHGALFRSQSDTEVLVEAICAWGLEAALGRIEGMFAIAAWDVGQRTLSLARDRSGIKPLFYGWSDGAWLFASELKALAAHPSFRASVNRDALILYFRLGYVPPPLSIYEGFYKLPPGTYLTLRPDTRQADLPAPKAFWSLKSVVQEGMSRPLIADDADAATQLERLLLDSVQRQRIADVPVGAFLSGGVDSSAVVSLLQSISPDPVRTFSIGFNDPRYDEAPFATAVARHLGTQHTNFYVTPEETLGVVPRLPTLYDEPFAEPSQIPTYLLARAARQDVKVVITGDGGDELFGGYGWYDQLRRFWALNRRLPRSARRPIAALIRGAVRNPTLKSTASRIWPRLGEAMTTKHHKLVAMFEADDARDLYVNLRSEWPAAEDLVLNGGASQSSALTDRSNAADFADVRVLAMYLDMLTFLPEHPLTKVDRATMAVGLEARVPLLDRDVVEFAWRLPMQQRAREGTTKFLLRQVLYRHVPRHLIERPKVGFAVPMGRWLRGPLRDWAAALLDPDRIRSEGYLNAGRVRQVWREHQSGERDWARQLWSVAVFQAWVEQQRIASAACEASVVG
jgi:asparagine synthase (glutamine-hydrolysing)